MWILFQTLLVSYGLCRHLHTHHVPSDDNEAEIQEHAPEEENEDDSDSDSDTTITEIRFVPSDKSACE